MAKIEVEIKVDAAVSKWLEAAPKTLIETLKQSLNAIGAHAASRAVPNAPIKSGALQESIRHTKPKVSGAEISIEVVADEPYALRMHEQLTTAGPLQLGSFSRDQPMTPEGGVGGRYITRAVLFNRDKYEKDLAKNLQEFLGKAGKAKVRVTKIPGTDGKRTF